MRKPQEILLLLILPCYLLEVNGRATTGINGNYQNYIDNSPSIAMKNNSKISIYSRTLFARKIYFKVLLS